MAGRQPAGYWIAKVRWDKDHEAWEKAELWDVVQGVFNLWPFGEGKNRCRCGKKLNLYFENSPEGLDRWALWCEGCQFVVMLEAAPETLSGTDVVVVSVQPQAASSVGARGS